MFKKVLLVGLLGLGTSLPVFADAAIASPATIGVAHSPASQSPWLHPSVYHVRVTVGGKVFSSDRVAIMEDHPAHWSFLINSGRYQSGVVQNKKGGYHVAFSRLSTGIHGIFTEPAKTPDVLDVSLICTRLLGESHLHAHGHNFVSPATETMAFHESVFLKTGQSVTLSDSTQGKQRMQVVIKKIS